MSDRVDIREPVYAICERLGLDPNLVRELMLTPRQATAVIYLTRDDGKKYIDPATDNAATRTEMFEIET